MLNRVVLIGRCVAQPELRFTANGIARTTFTLAVERPFKSQDGQKQTDFILCAVWRNQAEAVANHLKKGKLAAVDGRLEIRAYEKDGEKRRVAEVVADNVRFLEWGEKKEEQKPDPPADEGIPLEISDDDLPF